MNSNFLPNRKVQLAFGSTILALLAAGTLTYRSFILSAESGLWVRHTHAVLNKLQHLLFDLQCIESNSRNFVLTGQNPYLESFRAGIVDAERDELELRDLTGDNPEQQRRIPALHTLVAQKLTFAQRLIALRSTEGMQSAANAIASETDQREMDQFQVLVRQMENEEIRLLGLREAEAAGRAGQMKTALILGVLAAGLTVGFAGWSVHRDTVGRELTEETLRNSEEKYRLLLDEVQDYAIFMLDPLGTVITWNAGAQRIKGYTAEQIIGRNFSCFFSPEDIARARPEEILRLTVATGRHEERAIRVRKDGSRFLARVIVSALRDRAGVLRGFSEFSHDLSESTEAEAKYSGLLEAAPDAMVVVNTAGEIVLLNVQAEKQFGYRRDELLGQQIKNIIPVGFAERLIADGTRTAAVALAQHIGTGIELSGRRKVGSEFPIEIMLSPLESPEGVLITAAIRDISSRKAAEKHLGQMEARYRGLLEAAPDAMVVVNTGGEIVLLNVQAEKQFGYRRDELIGQKVTNIIPVGFAERIIADETRSPADALAQQIGTGIELVALRKDKSEFPIEIMLSPLESPEGVLITAAIRNISSRKAAEKHLGQMEARYRGLLEAAPDAMVVVNTGGEIVLLNVQAEKQFGYRRDELIGQKVTNIIPVGFAERIIADETRRPADALAQQIGTGIELVALRKDKSEFPIEIMLSPLESPEELLVMAAIRDITERKKFAEQLVMTVSELKRSNDELQQFAYVASHDLQEPLRMVASYTQLLAKRYKGQLDADADEFIGYATDGCNRMQGLIQDLLAYSRAGTNGKALSEVSSENALKDALNDLQSLIAESGAVVTHDALPAITSDKSQLALVFQNLVGNAIKYHGRETPLVHVSATRNGGKEWTFSVRDNGLGIDPQYFERIFILFQRLHGREEFKGTGIGLAVCKKIVERLGGRIWVESQPNQGSTFSFTMPESVAK